MKGRRPKPTVLKLLQGNPGHRAIGDVMTREPAPSRTGFREPPDHITGEARTFWFAQGREFVAIGTLTDADWPVFEDLCLTHEEKHQLTVRINALQAKRKPRPADAQELMMLRGIRRKAIEQFRKLASEFGGTATSRPRCRIPSGQGELPLGDEDPLSIARRELSGV